MNQPRPLDGRVALITGASRGLGAACAETLSDLGAHVVLIARTQGGLEALDDRLRAKGQKATLLPMDLKDMESIDRLGHALLQHLGRLDILLSCAGVLAHLTPVAQMPPKIWDEIMAVNLQANWRLIRSLDPLLQQSPDADVLAVTCQAAQQQEPFWGVYAASKAGLNALYGAYREETKISKIKVNLLDPGIMGTSLRTRAMPGEVSASLAQPEDIAPWVGQVLTGAVDRSPLIICRK